MLSSYVTSTTELVVRATIKGVIGKMPVAITHVRRKRAGIRVCLKQEIARSDGKFCMDDK